MKRASIVILVACMATACSGGGPASLEKSCNGGRLESCNRLASMLFEGAPIPEDKPKAIDLWKKACTGGLPAACTNLNMIAGFYDSGQGVPQDKAGAAVMYEVACKGGNQQACANAKTAR